MGFISGTEGGLTGPSGDGFLCSNVLLTYRKRSEREILAKHFKLLGRLDYLTGSLNTVVVGNPHI